MRQYWFYAFDCSEPQLKVNLSKDIWYMNIWYMIYLNNLSAMFRSCMTQVMNVWGDILIFRRLKWRNLAEGLILHTSSGSDSLDPVQRGLGSPLSLTTRLLIRTPLRQTIFPHFRLWKREPPAQLSMQPVPPSDSVCPSHRTYPRALHILNRLIPIVDCWGFCWLLVACSSFPALLLGVFSSP